MALERDVDGHVPSGFRARPFFAAFLLIVTIGVVAPASGGVREGSGTVTTQLWEHCKRFPTHEEAHANPKWMYWGTPYSRSLTACKELISGPPGGAQAPEAYFYAGRLLQELYFSDEARSMFRLGAKHGSPKAMLALGWHLMLYDDDVEAMLTHWQSAAELGDPVAQTELGVIHIGQHPFWSTPERIDRPRGLRELRAAADQGYPVAQFILGWAIWPDGDPWDESKQIALDYMRDAAAAGVLEARKTLAKRGYDVPPLESEMRYPLITPRELIFKRP